MKIINEYTSDKQIKNFPELENKIKEYYDLVISDLSNPIMTPRGIFEHRIAFKDIFYYIDFLYENNPQSVIDVGCGDNLFKKWFPNITGADVKNWTTFVEPDIIIDENFYRINKEKFDCGLALNSYHFHGFSNSLRNIENAMELIKTNGRFLFTINYEAFPNFRNGYDEKKSQTSDLLKRYLSYDEKIYDYFESSKYKIILFDPIVTRGYEINQNYINGNTRFILEK